MGPGGRDHGLATHAAVAELALLVLDAASAGTELTAAVRGPEAMGFLGPPRELSAHSKIDVGERSHPASRRRF